MRQHRTSVIAAIALATVSLLPGNVAQNGQPVIQIDAHAVWRPSQSDLTLIRKSCDSLSFPALGTCFARGMQRAGASAQAIALTNQLKNEAYLNSFIETGRVDIAFVTYPYRANQNEACLLVNGAPAIIDVDDLRQLPQEAMKRDKGYQVLTAKDPDLLLWPGDRGDSSTIIPGTLGGGGQRFVVGYRLLKGCHACARLASVKFAFDFDQAGKFQGIKYLSLQGTAQ